MSRRAPVPRRAAALATAIALLTGCSSAISGTGRMDDGTGGSGASASADDPGTTLPKNACPTDYVAPDPKRPRITLAFDAKDDLSEVTGTEKVVFTPDRPTDEVVFRLTANTPTSVEGGTKIQVTEATADPGGKQFTFEKAGAGDGTQGGLLIIPLDAEAPAGRTITIDLTFTLDLGSSGFDRVGRADEFGWWGSGQPLLAWERGVGWHKEPLLQFVGESATSEAADIDLEVTAPRALTVIASGTPESPTEDGDTKTWRWKADRARDVSVAVGPFKVKEGDVDGTTLSVGVPEGQDPADLYEKHERSIRGLVKQFGPFPYPNLNVALLPAGGGGIEYPGSILMLDSSYAVAAHETAHMYFYGMIGDSQARDPWLDEAFASYAEGLINGRADSDGGAELSEAGDVGDPMTDFNGDGEYFSVVYGKGEAALLAARQAAGPAKFDKALRCYVARNAWRIAQPDDLEAQLTGLPEAVQVLEKAGAL